MKLEIEFKNPVDLAAQLAELGYVFAAAPAAPGPVAVADNPADPAEPEETAAQKKKRVAAEKRQLAAEKKKKAAAAEVQLQLPDPEDASEDPVGDSAELTQIVKDDFTKLVSTDEGYDVGLSILAELECALFRDVVEQGKLTQLKLLMTAAEAEAA